ncbi:MAG: sigma 54-interacting transcriptional regulator [Ignavibacteriae bacterium]|nr:AAA family ATPase [Ignavibacteriota bacterium]NOG98344.1 sigma 54-interacting transcriptional regulator [Ignavibacteriota bacterium]
MDKNEFFRQASLKIMSNLDLKLGLQSCLKYISDYIPADRIYLQKYEHVLGAMRLVSCATHDHCEEMDTLVPLPEQSKEKMKDLAEIYRAGQLPAVLVINNPSTEPVTKGMLNALELPLSSAMSMPLIVEDQLIGALAVLAKGENRYTDLHAELYEMLKEPFFIAMSNTLEHREVLKLRDMLADDNKFLHSELRRVSGDEIIGAHFGLRDVMHKVQQVAILNSPVLLLGETGVGKDVIANSIHYSSSRNDAPFVSVNCGAIPDTLIDSELFGHEKGAFTGALAQKRGRFERANGGTIFLDEIGELPMQAQVRLLKVLQSKEIERVGGVKTINLDIRVIAATNRNLEEMVKKGSFREDLWFRLNVFPIWIPPLRDRISDLPAMLQHFINQKAKELKLGITPQLEPGAIDYLMQYHWPGNVRELQNVVERALILNPQGPISFKYLDTGEEKKIHEPISDSDEILSLEEMNYKHIQKVLRAANGKIHGKGGAADLLKVNANTLRNKMNKLGIDYKKK